ncbi:hypothetical protein BLOT_016784 [Blomia tropicalis]|nr:hypothetical protein BLOT_016784 [Blomia tropicalis]
MLMGTWKDWKKDIEKKSIESDILKAVEKSNQMFREVKAELNFFKTSTELIVVFTKKNNIDINMIKIRIENQTIDPNFKDFEAHPFTVIHSDNNTLLYCRTILQYIL